MLSTTSISFGMESAALSKDLFMVIAASNDEAKDALRKTCQCFHQRLSIKGPLVAELIKHPSFCTSHKNITFMAFDAAWDSNIDLLRVIMPKMKQQNYIYQYSLLNRWSSSIDLGRTVDRRMPAALHNELHAIACNSGCKLDYYIYSCVCDELQIACYRKDPQAIGSALAASDGNADALADALCIAIDRNSPACIKELLAYIENYHNQVFILSIWNYKIHFEEVGDQPKAIFIENCRMYQDILEVAMVTKKTKAFEALIENDVFRCLNVLFVSINGQQRSMLDWIVEWEKHNSGGQTIYSDMYRKHGGKPSDQLDANDTCVLQ